MSHYIVIIVFSEVVYAAIKLGDTPKFYFNLVQKRCAQKQHTIYKAECTWFNKSFRHVDRMKSDVGQLCSDGKTPGQVLIKLQSKFVSRLSSRGKDEGKDKSIFQYFIGSFSLLIQFQCQNAWPRPKSELFKNCLKPLAPFNFFPFHTYLNLHSGFFLLFIMSNSKRSNTCVLSKYFIF